MLEPSFVTHVARAVYSLEPQSIESLEQFPFDWRGIYHVQDAQDGSWVIRLLHLFGSYVADNALFLNPDFPFVLQKLQARYNVTRDIADIAVQYFE